MKRLPILASIIMLCIYTASADIFIPSAADTPDSYDSSAEIASEPSKSFIDSLRNLLYPEVRYYNYADSDINHVIKEPDPGPGIVLPPINPPSVEVKPVYGSIDINCIVGTIDFTTGTTPTGGKTYEIPLKVFPGVNGCEPKISLNYNSQSATSIVGYGWNIGGLSMISRGGKSLYYDGKCEGVKMNLSDSFYLDGKRLIVKSTVQNGFILYESEQGNIKVKGYVNDSAITHFDVFYPDGSKATFGYALDTNDNIQYPISKISDKFGNTVNYQYQTVNNHRLISNITYGKGKIEFKYEDRPDPIIYYFSDRLCSVDSRVSEIIVYNESQELWGYNLKYTYNHDTSLLVEIGYHCGNDLINPLTFSYGTNNTQGGFETKTTQLIAGYESDYGSTLRTMRGRFDYGTTDDGIIVYPNYNSYWHYYKESGYVKFGENRLVNFYPEDQKILIYTSLAEDYAMPQTDILTEKGFIDILCADLEGKLQESVIKVNNFVNNSARESLIFTVYKSNPYSGLSKAYSRTFYLNTVSKDEQNYCSVQPKYYYTGDFNGDGKQEVLAIGAYCPINNITHETKCYLFDLENDETLYDGHPFTFNMVLSGNETTNAWGCINSSDKVFTFDADGDGKTDICLINKSGTHIYTFQASADGTLSLSKIGSSSSPNKSDVANKDVLIGEFNGDNLIDILVSAPKGSESDTSPWTIYYSHGNGNFSQKSIIGPSRPDTEAFFGFFTHDIDGDGKSDLIKFDDDRFSVRTSNGNSIDTKSTLWVYGNPTSILIPSNINSRNSASQLISIYKRSAVKYTYRADKKRERLLTTMINSYKIADINEYCSLSDNAGKSSNYTMGGGAIFPFVNIREPFMVLSRNSIAVERTVYEETRYEYENAVLHMQGLGFQGFGKITSYDKYERPTISTFDPYNHGIITNLNSPAAEVSNKYTISVASDKTLKILLSNKTETNKLKGYSANFAYTYNSYGFPTCENVTYSDGISKKTDFKYALYTDLNNLYRIDMVVDKTITTTNNSDTFTERTQAINYSGLCVNTERQFINGNLINECEYQYDENGNLIKEHEKPYSRVNGLQNEYKYDEGLLIEETDPYGLKTQYDYDAFCNIIKRQDYTGVTTFEYDGAGKLIKQTNPDGTVKSVKYDWTLGYMYGTYGITVEETGKPTCSEFYNVWERAIRKGEKRFDGKIRSVEIRYDERGNIIRESLPFTGMSATKWITYEYDSFDRLVSKEDPSGKINSYSYSGSSTYSIEDGVSIARTYNSLGQLILSSDASGNVKYNLAADGQPITVEVPGGIIYWYYYDKYRRQDCVVDASAGLIRYKYDDWGNVSERTSAGKTMSYEFDDLNRVKKVTTPEFTSTYTYDAYNRLRSVISSNGTSRTMGYDKYGRIASWREIIAPGRYLNKDYSYTDGNIRSITYNTQSGLRLSENYTYENGTFVEGKVNGVTVYRLDDENENGQPTQITTGNIVRTYEYENYMPKSRQAKVLNKYIQNYAYEFDPETSCLIRRQDLKYGMSEKFGYDELNRLISAGAETYTYNTWGNIIEKSDVGEFEYELSNKPHALTKIIPNGASVPLRSQDITYTSFSRPSQISEGGLSASFTYNAFSERVKMIVRRGNSTIKTCYYSGDCYECDYNTSGNYDIEKLYLFGDYYDAPAVYVKDDDGGEIFYILRDYLGSITQVVNSGGTIVQELSYDAWGRLRDPETWECYPEGEEPDLFLGRGYTGHEHLLQFGLINMNARLYDPLVGRFLSPDPYVQMPDFTQNFNRFSYALNNPLCYVDEDGEFFWAAVGIGALIGGIINVGTHLDEIKTGGFLTVASYFLTGALAGGVGTAIGIGAAVGFGSMLGTTAASYTLATTGIIKGALIGMANGATSGFILDTGNSLIQGENIGNSLLNGLQGAATGGALGAITGGFFGGRQAWKEDANLLTGAFNRNYSGYLGYDENGLVRYVGITKRDPDVRFLEHWESGTNRSGLRFERQIKYLTKYEARVWEQQQINKYQMIKNGGQLYNLRNEISPDFWHYVKLFNFESGNYSFFNRYINSLW